MKIRNQKSVAIVMAFFFCLTFLAPAFVAPQVADAATAYRALSVPTFGSSNVASANLGVIEVDIPSGLEIQAGDVLSISLPSGVELGTAALPASNGIAVVNTIVPSSNFVQVYVPANHPLTGLANGLAAGMTVFNTAAVTMAADTNADGKINAAELNVAVAGAANTTTVYGATSAKIGATGQSIDITFGAGATAGRGVLYIYVNNASLVGVSGDLTATIMGSSASIPMAQVIVGKASTSGGTAANIKSVRTMGTAPIALDVITLVETTTNSLAAGNTISLKLPVGFQWTAPGMVGPNWAYAATVPYAPSINADPRILNVTVPATATGTLTATGRLDILNATIKVDDSVAKKGDVVVSVSGTGVTSQDITVAKFGEYKANVVEGTVKELTAGKAEQKLGTFVIEEEIPGSLVAGRVIKMSLPEGVKWWGGYRTGTAIAGASVIQGGIALPGTVFTVNVNDNGSSDNGRSIQTTIANVPTNSSGKVEFKDLKVDIAPDFKGEIKVTVTGAAGAAGEVKVANVNPAVELSADKVKNIVIGQQKQITGELLIKETAKEKIAFRNTAEWVSGTAGVVTAAANNQVITLTLPAGARWAGLPTVEVVEGDLQLDLNGMSDGNVAPGDNRRVTIPVKSNSLIASTVKVSNIITTVDRTVPEGDFKISIGGMAVNEVPNVFPQAGLPSQVVAKVVTPAGADAGNGQFRIDSNIYEIAGVSKVMDCAPYIKNSRTYVPVRYLGYALGLTDDNIVWDAATQKVTFTKDETTVELTIGSTTYTVNGESKTMDVAPEISSDRTMLPARFVAEAFGALVGWDPATRVVLIQQ